jgi:hypothetical protein
MLNCAFMPYSAADRQSGGMTASRIAVAFGAFVLALTSSALTQSGDPNVSGRWRVAITFDQGPIAGTFDLKQQGEGVTGRFVASFTGGDVPVEGEFSHGKLTLSGTTSGGPHPGQRLDFSADVKGHDAMSGMLSWEPGDFAWTAERIK